MKLILENWRQYLKEGIDIELGGEEAQRIPLNKIKPTEDLGYLKYDDPAEFEEVIANIEHSFEMGDEDPLDVIYDEAEDVYEIVDGHHRFQVASDWGLEDYPVNIVGKK
jgi:ParB-like chromosome segregation protein Spo0J